MTYVVLSIAFVVFNTEEGLKTTPCSECALNALAIDEPLEYARLHLEGNMQIWVQLFLATVEKEANIIIIKNKTVNLFFRQIYKTVGVVVC